MLGTRNRVIVIAALVAAMAPIPFANPGDDATPVLDPERVVERSDRRTCC